MLQSAHTCSVHHWYIVILMFKGRHTLLSENQRHREWSNRQWDMYRNFMIYWFIYTVHMSPTLMEVHSKVVIHNRIIFDSHTDCLFLLVQLTAWLLDLQFRFWYITNTSSLFHSHITLSWRYTDPQNMPNYPHKKIDSHLIWINIVTKECNPTFSVTREDKIN